MNHEHCDCGEHHDHPHHDCGHSHQHDCGCGAHHEHDDCGCGHHHRVPDYDNELTIAENNVLMALHERHHLPIARFALTSSRETEAYSIALEPVYIADPTDDMEQVKETGEFFSGMEEKDLIELNYDLPLDGYEYAEYRQSQLYAYFLKTVEEARAQGFLFDTPHLELGSIAMTERGRVVLQKMLDGAKDL